MPENKMTRDLAKKISDELKTLLTECFLLEGVSLDIKVGGGSFDDATFKPKIVFTLEGAVTQEQVALAKYAVWDEIDPDKEGPNGERLVEYKSRNRKYPYIYEKDGKRFKCQTSKAKLLFPLD